MSTSARSSSAPGGGAPDSRAQTPGSRLPDPRPPDPGLPDPGLPETEHMLDAMALMARVNDSLQEARDEDDLIALTCSALARTRHCSSVWYARPAPDETPAVIAFAGDAPSDLDRTSAPMPWSDAWQPAWDADPPAHPMESQVPCCALVLPVVVDGILEGAFVLLSDTPEDIDRSARSTLRLMVDHLAIGLANLRRGDDHSAHGHSERNSQLQSVLDAMIDPFVLMLAVRDDNGDLVDLRYAAANEIALQYNHLSRAQMIGTRLLDLFPGQREQGPCSSTSRPSRPASRRSSTTTPTHTRSSARSGATTSAPRRSATDSPSRGATSRIATGPPAGSPRASGSTDCSPRTPPR